MIKKLLLLICTSLPMVAHGMADSTPPVYGRPTLYGEYEITRADVARAGGMYGDAPRAIRAGAGAKSAAAKHPVKAKKVKPKKTKNVPRKSSARVGKKVPMPVKPKPSVIVTEEAMPNDVPVAPTAEVAAPTPIVTPADVTETRVPDTNIPREYAAGIRGALANKYDVSSYCVQVAAGDGVLPDGFVLMPGRPDLMSCAGKK